MEATLTNDRFDVSLTILDVVDTVTNNVTTDKQGTTNELPSLITRENYSPLIPKIPAFIRVNNNSVDYDPLVVSFGPYHHGNPMLKFVEDFKPKALQWFFQESGESELFWLEEVMSVVHDLRRSYIEGSTDTYTDSEFARFMLQDTCLAMLYIGITSGDSRVNMILLIPHLGMAAVRNIARDLCVLENQIPFWFLKLMLSKRYGQSEGEEIICKFLVMLCHGVISQNKYTHNIIFDEKDEPIHLVDALRRTLIAGWREENDDKSDGRHSSCKFISKFAKMSSISSYGSNVAKWTKKNDEIIEDFVDIKKDYYTSRSVTKLKEKGIKIKPNKSSSLKRITFESSCFHGTLRIPMIRVTYNSRAIYSNLIAYEMTPTNCTGWTITAYVYFMKSLIGSPKDVEELRGNKVVFNMLGSDEELMKLLNGVHTFGSDSSYEFGEVRQKILEHYNSKARTWLAQFLNTYFHSPWTVIALLASILVVSLTFVQTYYAVYPKGRN